MQLIRVRDAGFREYGAGRRSPVLQDVPDGIVKVPPSGPLTDNGLKIFLKHDLILQRILDYCADDIRREASGIDLTAAEMCRLRP